MIYNQVFYLPIKGYISLKDKDTSVDMSEVWIGMNSELDATKFSTNIFWLWRPDRPDKIIYNRNNVNWLTIHVPYGSSISFEEALNKVFQRFYVQLEFGDVSTEYVEPSKVQTATYDIASGQLSEKLYTTEPETIIYCTDRNITVHISVPISHGNAQNPSSNGEKSYYAIGDSITHGYNNTFTEGKQYFTYLDELCGFGNVSSNGECGTCIAEGSVARNFVSSSRLNMIPKDVDVISIFGGTNDWGNNYQLGNINSTEKNTFYGALKYYIEYLKNNYSDKTFFFITPIQRNCNYSPANGQNKGVFTNANGNTLEDFVNAMLEVCKYYNVPCLDLYNTCFIGDPENIKINYITDGLHPNIAGHEIIAKKIADFINSEFVQNL